jgi:hypothetical protein
MVWQLFFSLSVLLASMMSGLKKEEPFKPVAVIELFTSQGCSSCPPADKLLSETIVNSRSEQVFALSFHVDYWNRLGWKDPFSDRKYSERQRAYAVRFDLRSIYTPQMIVNGSKEFTGSDRTALTKALHEALSRNAEAQFKTFTIRNATTGSPEITYALEGNFTGCTLHIAFISPIENTIVKRGENEGRTLMNPNVVKHFFSVEAKQSGTVAVNVPPDELKQLSVIAYIQKNSGLTIIGAAEIKPEQ